MERAAATPWRSKLWNAENGLATWKPAARSHKKEALPKQGQSHGRTSRTSPTKSISSKTQCLERETAF